MRGISRLRGPLARLRNIKPITFHTNKLATGTAIRKVVDSQLGLHRDRFVFRDARKWPVYRNCRI